MSSLIPKLTSIPPALLRVTPHFGTEPPGQAQTRLPRERALESSRRPSDGQGRSAGRQRPDPRNGRSGGFVRWFFFVFFTLTSLSRSRELLRWKPLDSPLSLSLSLQLFWPGLSCRQKRRGKRQKSVVSAHSRPLPGFFKSCQKCTTEGPAFSHSSQLLSRAGQAAAGRNTEKDKQNIYHKMSLEIRVSQPGGKKKKHLTKI